MPNREGVFHGEGDLASEMMPMEGEGEGLKWSLRDEVFMTSAQADALRDLLPHL